MFVADIVSAVIVELSQVPGIATQIYSAGRIRQHVQDAYQLEIDALWWPRYMHWQTIDIDPATGLLASDIQGPISFVDDYENIRAVFPTGSNRKLPELPQSMNPAAAMGGGMYSFITPDYTIAHRPFKIVPYNGQIMSVQVHARQDSSLPLADDTDVFIDNLLLQYDAAWMYCIDDGTVPAQVNKFQMLATKRRKQLIASLAQQPLLLDPRYPDLLADERPYFVLDTDPLA